MHAKEGRLFQMLLCGEEESPDAVVWRWDIWINQ